MRRLAMAAIILALAAGPVVAQSPTDGTPTRVAGTIEKLDGRTLTVAGRDGQKQSVTLSADAKIFGVEKRKLTDIKPGDFVASGGVRGTDGKIHAVEVRIFPEELRGAGEGQRPWDVRPEGVMTNATTDGRWRRNPRHLQGWPIRIHGRPRRPGARLRGKRRDPAQARRRDPDN